MEERLKTEQQMIRYLLGDMSIEEQIAMETGYFTDPESFNLLQAVEQDLIEGYINGKLSAAGRTKFERHFLSTPARREQVKFFQTLVKVIPFETDQQVAEQPVRLAALDSIDLGRKSSWWESIIAPFRGPRLALGMSFAAAMLILAVAGTWIMVGNRGNDGQIASVNPTSSPEKVQAPNADQPEIPSKEVDSNRENEEKPIIAKPKPVTASFVLNIPGLRDINKGSTAPQVWRIPDNTDFVQMAFNHKGDPYGNYRVSLKYISGKQAWRRSDIQASRVKSGTLLIVNMPAKRIEEGSYSLEISRDNVAGEWVMFHEFLIEVVR
jgi:hypothetical protein